MDPPLGIGTGGFSLAQEENGEKMESPDRTDEAKSGELVVCKTHE